VYSIIKLERTKLTLDPLLRFSGLASAGVFSLFLSMVCLEHALREHEQSILGIAVNKGAAKSCNMSKEIL